MVLFGVGLYIRLPRLPFVALAAFWALLAACFSRPGLLAVARGLEPLVLLVPTVTAAWLAVVALTIKIRRVGGAPAARRALGSAALVPPFVVLDLLLPAAPILDAAVYSYILAAAGLAVRAAHIQRRSS